MAYTEAEVLAVFDEALGQSALADTRWANQDKG